MDAVLSFIERNRSLQELQSLPVQLSTLTLTPRFQASRHVVSLVFEAGQAQPILVAKMPRLPYLRDSLDHEADVLRSVQDSRTGGFHSVPRLVAYQDHYGYPILLETAINGRLMSPDVVRRDPERMIQLVSDWLLNVQSVPTYPHNDNWYHKFVESALNALRTDFPLNVEEEQLLQECEQYLSVLKGASLPYVIEHGDLGHPNLILTGKDSVGVIDWELATVYGLVVSDLFFFLSYVAFSRENSNQSGEYLCAFERAFWGQQAWALPHTRSFIEALKIRPDLVPALFLLCWLRYLVNFIERLQVQTARSISPETIAAVRNNRYFMIWKYTVEHFKQFSLS